MKHPFGVNSVQKIGRKVTGILILLIFSFNSASAGLLISKTNGITLTGADGITLTGADGITLTGADSFLNYQSNGITLTGADGITLTGADGITLTGADSSTYTGTNGITLTGADGITLTGADGITLTGADGITLTGADGVTRQADSVVVRRPNGITLTGADGITLTGADGLQQVAQDGITLTGADGITLTGADGITLTGADGITLTGADGAISNLVSPSGITLTGADGITLTGADGITLTGADGITLTGADQTPNQTSGLQSVDPELAVRLNQMTDDSTINAVITFHQYPTALDLAQLQQAGILGGTQFKRLPFIIATATRNQLIAVSHLPNVRSIYGNRTLNLNSDSFLSQTGITRVPVDHDLQVKNQGIPVSGNNVTVAVLDTGVNSLHSDLAGRVVQNVRLNDLQSASIGFTNPIPVENLPNTDPLNGHGTFVAGVIAASGAASGGKYNGVAPGARILGLSAGDLNLIYVLSGFDYLLDRGANYNARVVNCSFSANTVYDDNDPVNIATKMLTESGISVVFSAGNTGAGNGTLNPYAAAPWVISVGTTDEKGKLASFSSRGIFGNSQFSPTLVTPGVNIVSLRSLATQTGTLGLITGLDTTRLTAGEMPYYTTASGTSFSAPQVAGAIALMLETNPSLNTAQIKEILHETATPLPPYFRHEVGAGMINIHAAVLKSAFPNRKMGLFRSVLDRKAIKFTTSTTQNFSGTVTPGSLVETNINVPVNTIQSAVNISWGDIFSPNDLALKLYGADGFLRGESNNLNAPGLSGKREKITLNSPTSGTWRAVVNHTAGIGTTQNFFGAVETTSVEYANLSDISTLSPEWQAIVKNSLLSYLMLPDGNRFRPTATVSRADLAAALVRGGRVPQYMAATALFSDVNDLTTRGVVESVQKSPNGKLFYDATNGGAFRPDNAATRIIAAVALVKAANLQSSAQTAILSPTVTDFLQIPLEYRGYVAVALQKGFLTLDSGNKFAPNRPLTRLELAQAMVRASNLAIQ
jgi:serine protease AprX